MSLFPRGAGRPVVASPLLAIFAIAVYGAPSLASLLELDRSRVWAGEWWRLLTGHLTHWSFEHLLWDLVAFSILGFLCERSGRPSFLASVLLAAGAVSATLWLFHPEVAVYRGLSGVNAGLFVMLATSLLLEEDRPRLAAGIALGSFAAKTALELATGSSLFVSGTEVVELVESAHIAGSAAGVLMALSSRSIALAELAVQAIQSRTICRTIQRPPSFRTTTK